MLNSTSEVSQGLVRVWNRSSVVTGRILATWATAQTVRSEINCPVYMYKRHTMYVSSNIEARSGNHCCRGKAVSITYCEGVFVALVIQHSMYMRHIVTCGLPLSKTLFHGTIFGGKKKLLKIQCVFWLFIKCLSETFLVLRRTEEDSLVNCVVLCIVLNCVVLCIVFVDCVVLCIVCL